MDTSVDVWDDVLALLYFSLAFNFGAAVMLAWADWSQMDKPEAPDWGSASLQIADAQSYQDFMAAKEGLITQKEVRQRTLVRHNSSMSLQRAMSGLGSPSWKQRQLLSPQPQYQGGPPSGGIAPTPGGGRRRLGEGILRALRGYNSASTTLHSQIVVPMVTDEDIAAMEREQAAAAAAAAARSRSDGGAGGSAGAAAVASSSASSSSSPSLPLGTQPVVVEVPNDPSSSAKDPTAPGVLSPGGLASTDATLARTHLTHYHHDVVEVDVAKLLADPELDEVSQEVQADADAAAAAGDQSSKAVVKAKPRLARQASTASAPVKGAVLEWSNLSYSVPVVDKQTGKTVQKKLLDNCFGFAKPGNMVALMGSSGAGQTKTAAQ